MVFVVDPILKDLTRPFLQVQRRRQLTLAQKQEMWMLEQRKAELSVQEKQVLDLFKQVPNMSFVYIPISIHQKVE